VESVSAINEITGGGLRLQAFSLMTEKRSQRLPRKPRADAQRNRERILDVAKQVFARSGAHASLDEIARHAKVGPGTLYRHFPTREDLLKAVYRTEMEKLAAAARKFGETMPPVEALRAWMLLFVDAIAMKQLIAPALNAILGDPKKVFESSHAQIQQAILGLVERGVKSGDIRKDVDANDLFRALVGAAHVASNPDWEQSARRLVNILILGSRTHKRG
jgi:AcrR family transcriptional regulator